MTVAASGELADHDGNGRLDDAGLLEGDLAQRRPEVRLMIECDRGDRGGDRGDTTFVASSRPPSPTSSTATSTPARRNSSKAAAVVTSKKVGWTSRTPSAQQRVDRPPDVGDHGGQGVASKPDGRR